MTAKITHSLLKIFKEITDVRFVFNNYIWSLKNELTRRQINIDSMIISTYMMPPIKEIIDEVLKNNLNYKLIIFTKNTKNLRI